MSPEAEETDRIEFESPDGKFRGVMWLGEQGLLFARSIGHEDLDSAKRIADVMRGLQRKYGRRFRLCLDISEMTGSDPAARKYMREHMLAEGSTVERIAVVGGNVFMRGLYNMFAKVARLPMKVFARREQAVRWLLES